mmetsp:Transcript_22122/g.50585  ORF Transcript_22122/g.50585 Transcript_22122/m.50585 type:complete len:400 (+) Transcript_22122:1112-2311(+)
MTTTTAAPTTTTATPTTTTAAPTPPRQRIPPPPATPPAPSATSSPARPPSSPSKTVRCRKRYPPSTPTPCGPRSTPPSPKTDSTPSSTPSPSGAWSPPPTSRRGSSGSSSRDPSRRGSASSSPTGASSPDGSFASSLHASPPPAISTGPGWGASRSSGTTSSAVSKDPWRRTAAWPNPCGWPSSSDRRPRRSRCSPPSSGTTSSETAPPRETAENPPFGGGPRRRCSKPRGGCGRRSSGSIGTMPKTGPRTRTWWSRTTEASCPKYRTTRCDVSRPWETWRVWWPGSSAPRRGWRWTAPTSLWLSKRRSPRSSCRFPKRNGKNWSFPVCCRCVRNMRVPCNLPSGACWGCPPTFAWWESFETSESIGTPRRHTCSPNFLHENYRNLFPMPPKLLGIPNP